MSILISSLKVSLCRQSSNVCRPTFKNGTVINDSSRLSYGWKLVTGVHVSAYRKTTFCTSVESEDRLSPMGQPKNCNTRLSMQIQSSGEDDTTDTSCFSQIIQVMKKLPKDSPDVEKIAKQALSSVHSESGKVIIAPGLSHLSPALPVRSKSLAPYINHVPLLRSLIDIGVDLSSLSTNVDPAQLIHLPYDNFTALCLFLCQDIGVSGNELSSVLTACPELLFEDISNLKARVDYLSSKKFTTEDIYSIALFCPKILCLSIKQLDTKLGFVQAIFQLSGVEVRTSVTRYPKILFSRPDQLKINRTALINLVAFEVSEAKLLFVRDPKLYTEDIIQVQDAYRLLVLEAGFPRNQVLEFPAALRTPLRRITMRHHFLKLLNRDQYDPQKPNFVPINDFCKASNEDFCKRCSKTEFKLYIDYLKTV